MSGEQLSINKLRISKGSSRSYACRKERRLSDMDKSSSRLHNRKLTTVDSLMSRKKMS
jgi:hypothetical protein